MRTESTKFSRGIRHFLARETGNSTIEFLLWFPVFITLFLTSFELSIYSMRTVLLDRALDIALRQLRIGNDIPETQDAFKQLVCDNLIFGGDCMNELAIDLQSIDTNTWDLPIDKITCVDRSSEIAPQVSYSPTAPGIPTLVAACLSSDPFFSSTTFVLGLPRDPTGAVAITSLSVYVQEPV